MKAIGMMMAVLMCLVWTSAASAMDVKLRWDPNTEADLAGYKIYYGVDVFAGPVQQDVAKQTVATISGLDPAGSYSFAVVAYNTSGLESAFSNIVKVSESVPPSVSITSPGNNSKVSNAILISASASDNVGVTKVEFYLDGILKATQAAEPFQYSWNTLAGATGVHTVTAKAYDAAGNAGASTVSVNVVNDLTPPSVLAVIPPQGGSASGVVTITADASDDVGISLVEFYVNSTLGAAVNQPPYTYDWDTTTVANGSYSITAKAYDASGKSTTSPVVAVTVNNPTPIVLPSGDINGSGTVDLADVLLALQIAVGKVTASAGQLTRGDIAPVVKGISQPNGKIDIADVIVILEQVVGK